MLNKIASYKKMNMLTNLFKRQSIFFIFQQISQIHLNVILSHLSTSFWIHVLKNIAGCGQFFLSPEHFLDHEQISDNKHVLVAV